MIFTTRSSPVGLFNLAFITAPVIILYFMEVSPEQAINTCLHDLCWLYTQEITNRA